MHPRYRRCESRRKLGQFPLGVQRVKNKKIFYIWKLEIKNNKYNQIKSFNQIFFIQKIKYLCYYISPNYVSFNFQIAKKHF